MKAKKTERPEKAFYNLVGTITTAMYGKRTFANGKSDKENKYRLSLKCSQQAIDGLKEAAEPFYEDVKEDYIPNWYKEDASADGGYINLASGFDIRVGMYEDGRIVDKGKMVDFINENGGNINGSKVVVSVTIKKGSIYPSTMIIKELKVQDISSMFNENELDSLFSSMPF